MKTSTALSKQNWDEARKHLQETQKQYLDLIGQPHVNPYFALANLTQLENRFQHGERTLDLYIQMMTAQ